jgi:hypothetical protein
MSIRTTRAATLALCLAANLVGGLMPAHVLCLHHDGDVTIERAARGAVRCDDLAEPCVSTGLAAAPGQDHCHDAAIAQPGLGQRASATWASAPPALAVVRWTALDRVVAASIGHRAAPGASPARARRTIVLRV